MRIIKTTGRLLSAFAGSALILLGGLGVLFSIHALIDPAAAQAADENNPFGQPPTFLSAWLELFLYGYLLASDAVPPNQSLELTAGRCTERRKDEL
jgi:hypothetical protein